MNWEEEALVRISAQVHNCEHMLIYLIRNLAPDFSQEDAKVKQITESVQEAQQHLPPPGQPTTNG